MGKSTKIISAAASTVGLLAAIVCAITAGTVTGSIFAAVCAVCACAAMYTAFNALKLTRSPVYGKVPRAVFLFLALHAVAFAAYAFMPGSVTLVLVQVSAAVAVALWGFSMLKKFTVAAFVFVVLVAVSQFGVFSFYITMAVTALFSLVACIIARKKGGVYNSVGVAVGVAVAALSVVGFVMPAFNATLYTSLALLALMFIMTLAGSFKTLIPAATLAARDIENIKAEVKQPEPAQVIETAAKKGKKKADTAPLTTAVPEKKSGNAYAKAVGRAYGGSTKIASAAAANAAAVANDAKNKMVEKEYQKNDWQQLLSAPTSALKGITAAQAQQLTAALNIKTIGDLADNKFFAAAAEIVKEAK